MGMKTKIDWCDATWNPVTGCLHGCEYCYARRIAERFKGFHYAHSMVHGFIECKRIIGAGDRWWQELYEIGENAKLLRLSFDKNGHISFSGKAPYPFGFMPTLHRYKLDEPQKWKKPRTIFVCSMADLFGSWVPDEWIKAVFDACAKAPQHRYIFLTKAPERYKMLIDHGIAFPDNCWLGTSVTHSYNACGKKNKLDSLTDSYDVPDVHWFASVEPIFEEMQPEAIENLAMLDWVIIGAETGQRKNRVIPKKEWIMNIAKLCRYYHVPVFMKESLRDLMGSDFRQELPWEVDNQC